MPLHQLFEQYTNPENGKINYKDMVEDLKFFNYEKASHQIGTGVKS